MPPKIQNTFVQVYERVMTLGPFSYLFCVDLKQEIPENMRLIANILEDEEKCYFQKNNKKCMNFNALFFFFIELDKNNLLGSLCNNL